MLGQGLRLASVAGEQHAPCLTSPSTSHVRRTHSLTAPTQFLSEPFYREKMSGFRKYDPSLWRPTLRVHMSPFMTVPFSLLVGFTAVLVLFTLFIGVVTTARALDHYHGAMLARNISFHTHAKRFGEDTLHAADAQVVESLSRGLIISQVLLHTVGSGGPTVDHRGDVRFDRGKINLWWCTRYSHVGRAFGMMCGFCCR